jgi:ribosomal protein L11 methyltransferase
MLSSAPKGRLSKHRANRVRGAKAMAVSPGLWRMRLHVAGQAAAAFAEVLEPHAGSTSWTEPVGGRALVEALSENEPDRALLEALLGEVAAAFGLAPPALDVAWLAGRDWLAENRLAFPPVEVGRYFIHGSHFGGSVPVGRIGLRLDAATAFGSGEHGSTRGCLMALDGLARRRRFRNGLDLGCGSGILAIAMAKTWGCPVVAADVDDEAVRVAADNAKRNGAAALIQVVASNGYRAPALRRGAPFDLIVANILARPLDRLATGLERHLARRGLAVLAGLLEDEAAGVLSTHRRRGLRLDHRITLDGWTTLVLRR